MVDKLLKVSLALGWREGTNQTSTNACFDQIYIRGFHALLQNSWFWLFMKKNDITVTVLAKLRTLCLTLCESIREYYSSDLITFKVSSSFVVLWSKPLIPFIDSYWQNSILYIKHSSIWHLVDNKIKNHDPIRGPEPQLQEALIWTDTGTVKVPHYKLAYTIAPLCYWETLES